MENVENENLDSLFEDVFAEQPAEQPAEAPADDNGKQDKGAAGKKDAPKPAQDAAENARQAAARRSRERRQLIEQAKAEERDRMNDILRRVGIEKEDGSTIETMDDLEAFYKAQSDERIARGNANADDIRRIAQEAAQTDDGSDRVRRQLETIAELDPTMTDLGAILQSDIGEDFKAEVQNGATFLQAYGRAVRARDARATAARTSEAAKAAGKGHLSSTSQRGSGALDVPADEMAIFRELMPEASDADIQKYYNADRKKFGG